MPDATVPDHILRPRLRRIQLVPVEREGQRFVALRDPSMLHKQTMFVPFQAMPVIQHFDGERTLDELADQFKSNADQLAQLARSMDSLGLLWGPTSDTLERERWQQFETSGAFPTVATTSLGEDGTSCRTTLQGYFEQTDDPELEQPAAAIVAPHLDYDRGWPNYAAAYYPLIGTEPPDRVVVLGTNHFGLRDNVVLAELGFETPLGRCPADDAVIGPLVQRFGRPLVVDQLDHFAEHSIELQLPWLQYCFGNVPVVAALVPDPLVDTPHDDEDIVGTAPFVEALAEALEAAGGRTFFVASSDLSHVGPQFGEPRPVDDQRRIDVERHDREMMSKFIAGDPGEFIAAMRWNKNPTRWCSIGNMAALLSLVQPNEVELIDYRQAYDERGAVLVSSAAMVLT